jgi:hypothetical protein
MIKVIVDEDSYGRLRLSTDVMYGDVTVDIPERVYESYHEASRKLFEVEKVIRMFMREQERSRAYADD